MIKVRNLFSPNNSDHFIVSVSLTVCVMLYVLTS